MNERVHISVSAEDRDVRNAVKRKRTAIALAVWTLLPIALAINDLAHGDLRDGALLSRTAILSGIAAALALSRRSMNHTLAVVLVVVAALPFAVSLVQGLAFLGEVGWAEVADSPVGYFTGTMMLALFVVPLIVFAQAIWRRRAKM